MRQQRAQEEDDGQRHQPEHRPGGVRARADDVGAARERAADRRADREQRAHQREADGETAELGHGSRSRRLRLLCL